MIVDIDTPKITGSEFIARIPVLTPRIPVIFITGLGTHDSAVLELTQQNFPILHKPFRPSQLVRAVEAAIARFRLDRMAAET
jgi:DNA-binding NtrC family response regulator